MTRKKKGDTNDAFFLTYFVAFCTHYSVLGSIHSKGTPETPFLTGENQKGITKQQALQ